MCSMFIQEFSSFLAALLFAVHPIHTEAVSLISTMSITFGYRYLRLDENDIFVSIFMSSSERRARLNEHQTNLSANVKCKEQVNIS